MMENSTSSSPAARGDPRFDLAPAELVAALSAGRIAIDLVNYPDADTAIYGCISQDRRDKTSVERQLEIGIEYAQAHQMSYVIFTDRKSAYRRGVVRKDYEALLNAIRARRIRRLVSYKIDRLYRQVEELMDVIKIADHGRVPVTLIGIDDEDVFDLTTAKGCDEAIGRVLEAQKESRRTSERTRMQRRKWRQQGMPNPAPPAFGWRDRTQHDPTTAKALKQAYESILHGTSVAAISRTWNDQGFRGTLGGRWDDTGVKRVLMNQRNVGRLTHTYEAYDEQGNKRTVTEIVRENAFDPIVDAETFDAVQRELARRARPSHQPRRRSMLTSLVRCSKCGNTLTRTTVQGTLVYRCSKYRGGRQLGCGGVQINAAYLEPFVETALFKYIDSPEFARTLAARSEIGSRRAELMAERDRLTKVRDAIRKKMLAADYDDELYGYEQDVREIAEQLRDVSAQLAQASPTHPASVWAGGSKELREAWDNRLDADEKRAIIADAFGGITVKPSRVVPVGQHDPTRIELGLAIDDR